MSSQDSNSRNDNQSDDTRRAESRPGLSRRRLFGAVGAGAVLAGAGAAVAAVGPRGRGIDLRSGALPGYPSGRIVTAAQDRMHFVAFDVITDSRDELVAMLKKWTEMAARMTAGEEAAADGAVGAGEYNPPTDTVRHWTCTPRSSRSRSGSDRLCSTRTVRTASGSRTGSRRRSPTCPSSPETRSSRPAPAATSRSRPAPTTRRWRCTRCATWPASASVWWRCGGRSSDSGARPRRRRPRRLLETCSGSRTEHGTSRPRTPRRCRSSCGWIRRTTRHGWRVARTWWPAASGC